MRNEDYVRVLATITNSLNEGVIPWRKEWTTARPTNFKGRPYSGINRIILSLSGYEGSRWGTFNQVQEFGGNLKGQKSTIVTYWGNASGKPDEETGKVSTFMFMKTYLVFNENQALGIKLPPMGEPKKIEAEQVLRNYVNCPKIKFGNDRASYSVTTDTVSMPSIQQFTNANEYYSTLFHELAHSTGAQDRLNRKSLTEMVKFGSDPYALEELIAELTAGFLCNSCGIDNTLQNTAAYCQGWLKKFADDPKMLIHAASAAEKASNYILGITKTEE